MVCPSKLDSMSTIYRTLWFAFCFCSVSSATRYEPNWESIDSRPLPSWYDEGKIGIFLHWGVFSVPSYVNAWFWYLWKTEHNFLVSEFMAENYKPDFTYADFAPQFTAEFYDPNRWAEIFNASGANYVVLVTKHHEGFTNWPSKYSWNWNAGDVGPNRDLVGDLANAIRKNTKIHFGVYHSLFEFYNPLYLEDEKNKYTTNRFVREKTMPELYELVNNYKPDVIWSDGDWMVDDTYWNATNFLAWLYNDSPVKDTVAVNDRWGKNIRCKHGGFLNCNDRFLPDKLPKRKWENCMTIDKHAWTYRRNANINDFLTMEELVAVLTRTVSLGGNLLINAGPTSWGTISPIFEERLRQMGQWLGVNGEAIYGTKPWTHQNDTITPSVWYTSKKTSSGTAVYALLLKWPKTVLTLGAPVVSSDTNITLLGFKGGAFTFKAIQPSGVTIDIPVITTNDMPCKWGWVLKMENLSNQ